MDRTDYDAPRQRTPLASPVTSFLACYTPEDMAFDLISSGAFERAVFELAVATDEAADQSDAADRFARGVGPEPKAHWGIREEGS